MNIDQRIDELLRQWNMNETAVEELLRILAHEVQDATRREDEKICHDISIAAFVEREDMRNNNVHVAEIFEQTGRHEAAQECERAIAKLKE